MSNFTYTIVTCFVSSQKWKISQIIVSILMTSCFYLAISQPLIDRIFGSNSFGVVSQDNVEGTLLILLPYISTSIVFIIIAPPYIYLHFIIDVHLLDSWNHERHNDDLFDCLCICSCAMLIINSEICSQICLYI